MQESRSREWSYRMKQSHWSAIESPVQPGEYTLVFDMVSENVAWFCYVTDSSVVCFPITVAE